jgi:hypothetical protein
VPEAVLASSMRFKAPTLTAHGLGTERHPRASSHRPRMPPPDPPSINLRHPTRQFASFKLDGQLAIILALRNRPPIGPRQNRCQSVPVQLPVRPCLLDLCSLGKGILISRPPMTRTRRSAASPPVSIAFDRTSKPSEKPSIPPDPPPPRGEAASDGRHT